MKDIFDNVNIEFSKEILAAADEAIRQQRHLKLTTDVNFKMFFCGQSPESKECLRRFVSAIINKNIKEISVSNPEILPEMINGKESRLDINCIFDDGNTADVELQCTKAKDNQRNRALYYGSKMVANSLKKGANYSDMRMNYQIMILDYKEFDDSDDDDFYTEFVMFSPKKQIVLSECEKIIFIELPKLRKIINDDFNDLTPLQFWSILIKYSNNALIMGKLHSVKKFSEDSSMADMTLEQMSESRKAWAINLSREGGERELHCKMQYEREQGYLKGMLDGAHNKAIETAKKMKLKKLDTETIAELTELTTEEIQNL